MKGNKMKKYAKILVLAAAVSSMVQVASAQTQYSPGTLGWLINEQASLYQGDKIFSGFTLSSSGPGGASVYGQALDMSVYVTQVGSTYYLNFEGLVTAKATADLLLGYNVQAINGGRIDAIDQRYIGGGSLGGLLFIDESVSATLAGDVIAESHLAFPGDSSDPNGEVGDVLVVQPSLTQVFVQKDIGFDLSGATSPDARAQFSLLVQSVHQPGLPDGGLTLALLGFGLVGIEGLRRRLTK